MVYADRRLVELGTVALRCSDVQCFASTCWHGCRWPGRPVARGSLLMRFAHCHKPVSEYFVHVLCAWCGVPIRSAPTPDGRDDGLISHGICPCCATELLLELPRLLDDADG